MTGDDDTITLADAVERSGLSPWALRAMGDSGRLPIYRIGRRLYTSTKHLDAVRHTMRGSRNVTHKGAGVYVIGFDNYIKIGWSENLAHRLNDLRLSMPVEITIYTSWTCAKINEAILHRRFKAYRTRGEWFRHEGAVAEWVKARCPL